MSVMEKSTNLLLMEWATSGANNKNLMFTLMIYLRHECTPGFTVSVFLHPLRTTLKMGDYERHPCPLN